MDFSNIPQDDLVDVIEMTNKLEEVITDILQENDMSIAMSSLIGATINCTTGQCDTLDEILFYRNMFVRIFDECIRNIRITETKKKKPSS